jgi:predicted metal-binding membrane protein
MPRIWTAVTKEQFWVLFSLAGLTLLAWLYLVQIASDMPNMNMSDAPNMGMTNMPGMDMSDGMMPSRPQGAPSPVGVSIVMWAVMMIGMMLPSAIPVMLLYATVQHRNSTHPRLAVTTFLSGYLLVWGGFSVLAATLQTLLASSLLLSPSLALTSHWSIGLLLLIAGLYELSPLKGRCLDQCRGPVSFIASHWRPGLTGALRMGVVHGAYCLGCCWALMLLLFVAGVMNHVWVAVLAAVVLIQKIAPGGPLLSRIGGAGLSVAGVVLLVQALT